MILHEQPDFAAAIQQDDDEWMRWHDLESNDPSVPAVDVTVEDTAAARPTPTRAAHRLVEYDVMLVQLTRSL